MAAIRPIYGHFESLLVPSADGLGLKTPQWMVDERSQYGALVEPASPRLAKRQFLHDILATVRDAKFVQDVMSRANLRERPGYLVIKAYAHDRVVMAAGLEPQATQKVCRWRDLARSARDAVLRLERHRESQNVFDIDGRGYKIPARTRFTTNGRNWVKDGACVLERETPGKAIFATMTIAGGTDDCYDVLSYASGYIVNRFNSWLRTKLPDADYLYVWELQERGAPHLHYLFKVSEDCEADDIHVDIKNEWRRILLDLCEWTHCDLFERKDGGTWLCDVEKPFVDVATPDGDLGSYLGKYLSKRKSKNWKANCWVPGRWWALSYSLRSKVRPRRLRVKLEFPNTEAAERLFLRLQAPLRLAFGELFSIEKFDTFGARFASLDVPLTLARTIGAAMLAFVEDGTVPFFLSQQDGDCCYA